MNIPNGTNDHKKATNALENFHFLSFHTLISATTKMINKIPWIIPEIFIGLSLPKYFMGSAINDKKIQEHPSTKATNRNLERALLKFMRQRYRSPKHEFDFI